MYQLVAKPRAGGQRGMCVRFAWAGIWAIHWYFSTKEMPYPVNQLAKAFWSTPSSISRNQVKDDRINYQHNINYVWSCDQNKINHYLCTFSQNSVVHNWLQGIYSWEVAITTHSKCWQLNMWSRQEANMSNYLTFLAFYAVISSLCIIELIAIIR